MDKFLTHISDNISFDVAKTVADIMPMGHICVCYLSRDKSLVEKAIKEVSEFEYKITRIEFPDGVESNEENAQDIINSADDIRLFLGIGGREIAALLSKACEKRYIQYALITNSPFLYGVGYAIKGVLPIKLIIDKEEKVSYEDYAKCVGAILAHRVSLWEKKYIHFMMGIQDYANLKYEQDILDSIIGDGQMSDHKKLFDGMLEYATIYDDKNVSSAEILAELIEKVNLTDDRGESLLLASIALIKYFKSIMSIEEYYLICPADLSLRCRNLAKIIGTDVSYYINKVKDRKFKDKWLYIHSEYRQDLLNEIEELDLKLLNIIKSAKRYLPDVGYHFGDDYDIGSIIQLIYNMSPVAHECSPIAMADILFGD